MAVANGTDAIELALRAHDIGPGDEVITVSHTAVATVAAIEAAGAKPVLVDVDASTYCIDPAAVAAAIGPRTAAILPVHLYGHPAPMPALRALAERHHLLLVEDAAQALGARLDGVPAGALADAAAISFYPTKTLGAFGDAGAVITDDAAIAARLRGLRSYGQTDRYLHGERGINSRMDELQAAILSTLLPHLREHARERRQLADVYGRHLRRVSLPVEAPGAEHAFHLYVIASEARDDLREALAARDVGTLVHYPLPVHRQPAYSDLGYRAGSLPVTERVAHEILSLPLYVGMAPADAERVSAAVNQAVGAWT